MLETTHNIPLTPAALRAAPAHVRHKFELFEKMLLPCRIYAQRIAAAWQVGWHGVRGTLSARAMAAGTGELRGDGVAPAAFQTALWVRVSEE